MYMINQCIDSVEIIILIPLFHWMTVLCVHPIPPQPPTLLLGICQSHPQEGKLGIFLISPRINSFNAWT